MSFFSKLDPSHAFKEAFSPSHLADFFNPLNAIIPSKKGQQQFKKVAVSQLKGLDPTIAFRDPQRAGKNLKLGGEALGVIGTLSGQPELVGAGALVGFSGDALQAGGKAVEAGKKGDISGVFSAGAQLAMSKNLGKLSKAERKQTQELRKLSGLEELEENQLTKIGKRIGQIEKAGKVFKTVAEKTKNLQLGQKQLKEQLMAEQHEIALRQADEEKKLFNLRQEEVRQTLHIKGLQQHEESHFKSMKKGINTIGKMLVQEPARIKNIVETVAEGTQKDIKEEINKALEPINEALKKDEEIIRKEENVIEQQAETIKDISLQAIFNAKPPKSIGDFENGVSSLKSLSNRISFISNFSNNFNNLSQSQQDEILNKILDLSGL
jgi:hypothetical protein